MAAEPTASRAPGSAWPRAATWIVLGGLPLKLALALGTDLSPDEAYYLCAARRPELVPPMPDHPPLLPWLLRASDALLGPTPVELRVRIWPLLLSTLSGLLVVELARRRGADGRGCVAAACLGTWTLLPMTGGFVATPDALALPAILLLLLVATEPPAGRPAGGALTAAAVAAAGALGKVVVLPVAALVALLGRVPTATRAALVIGCLAPLPWLLPSLRFQLGHATGAASAWTAIEAASALAQLVTAQLALWSPWALVLGVLATAARRSRLVAADVAVAAGFTALVVVSTLARAIPAEPNWWAPAAVVVMVAAAVRAQELARTYRTTMLALAIVPTLLVASHVLRPWLPLRPEGDPTARLHGWSTGVEPLAAPGLGAYAAPAERCVYREDCDEITFHFHVLKQRL
jgi:hypothetical protein